MSSASSCFYDVSGNYISSYTSEDYRTRFKREQKEWEDYQTKRIEEQKANDPKTLVGWALKGIK